MLIVDEVTKAYGRKVVNHGVSLTVRPGEIAAVFGPNGAGKTTLVRQIVGLLRPNTGTIRIGAELRAPRQMARKVAYQPQAQIALESLTVRESIHIAGMLRGLTAPASADATTGLLAELQIGDWSQVAGHRLSGGLRRLVAFAMTMNSRPELVVLDEPTNDVDPERRRLMWQALRRRSERAAVVVITHNVHEAVAYADTCYEMAEGRLGPAQLPGGTLVEPPDAQRVVTAARATYEPGTSLRTGAHGDLYLPYHGPVAEVSAESGSRR
ncbi:ABC transporter ATP-binding protein [Xylanimonas allomyrinae]|uniref:ABC transporter ATP-binding protein n=1 Tax=Xylanimonas allomyrinae TaxID=2509459 RepID=A0A4P6EJX4_9MICO|nr:ABC transporter ATP-binding protein [Xylanimonas allomyrinae]QAY62874.1 ABC transporter ATP-binding protein [Xylanimonas allomyrinae]